MRFRKRSAKKKPFKGTKVGTKTIKNEFEEQTYSMLLDRCPQVEYESQKLEYTLSYNYIPDFRVTTASGKSFFIETKGNGRSWSPSVRKKMAAIRTLYPDLDLRFLFYTDGEFGTKRKDGSRASQSEWATKHGYQYAIKHLPESWLV